MINIKKQQQEEEKTSTTHRCKTKKEPQSTRKSHHLEFIEKRELS
jgi:hypothetical protein